MATWHSSRLWVSHIVRSAEWAPRYAEVRQTTIDQLHRIPHSLTIEPIQPGTLVGKCAQVLLACGVNVARKNRCLRINIRIKHATQSLPYLRVWRVTADRIPSHDFDECSSHSGTGNGLLRPPGNLLIRVSSRATGKAWRLNVSARLPGKPLQRALDFEDGAMHSARVKGCSGQLPSQRRSKLVQLSKGVGWFRMGR